MESPGLVSLIVGIFVEPRLQPAVAFAVINIQVFQCLPFLVLSTVDDHRVSNLCASVVVACFGDLSLWDLFVPNILMDIE